jgi:tetratricopeptide (TPR) repeat protein
VRSTRFHPLTVAVLLAGLTSAVRADFEASYSRAVKAFEQRAYDDAIKHLQDAIKEQPKEDTRRVNIQGNRYEPYLPHFYLGRAFLAKGDCVNALKSWRVSAGQRVVNRNQMDVLEKGRGECQERLKPAVNAAREKAEAALRAAKQKGDEVESLRETPTLSPIWSRPELGGTEQKAMQLFGSAQDKIEEGVAEYDVAELETARESATRAAALFDETKRNGFAEQKRLLAMKVDTPTPPKAANSGPGNAPVTPPTAPPAQPPPPSELRTAIDLYFQGEYNTALVVLRRMPYDSGRAGAQRRLFRSATAFALWGLSLRRNASLLEEAQTAARDCRRLDPSCAPDPEWFSPGFVQFFRSAAR